MVTGAREAERLAAEADRKRVEIAETVAALRRHLSPSHLVREWRDTSRMGELTLEKVYDYAVQRHPIPTAAVGACLLLWWSSMPRRRNSGNGKAEEGPEARSSPRPRPDIASPGAITRLLDELTEQALESLHRRVNTTSQEVIDRARARVSSSMEELGDAVERELDALIAPVSGPAVSSAVTAIVPLVLAAALESALSRGKG